MSKDLENLLTNSQPPELIDTPTAAGFPNRGIQTTGGSVGQAASDTVGFETLLVSVSEAQLTPVGDPTRAFITTSGGEIRFRTDGGGPPSAAIGHVALDNAVISLNSAVDIAAFRAIRKDAGDVTLTITYLI